MNNPFLKKTVIIALCYLLIIGALVYFVLLPTYNSYLKNKKLSLEKQALVEDNESKINSLKKVENDNEEFSKLFQNVNNLWPDTLEVSDFIVQTEGLAKDTGIIIDSFAIDEQKPAATATKTSPNASEEGDASASKNTKTTNAGTKFTVTFKTSYATFIDVISRMETLSRLNTINSVKLNTADQGLSVSLTGTIYYGK